ncbi:lectin BRA-3-like [Saccoglossus kowalevskii]|uniref:Lectin BRA-3-like n=1 Tax=Saccoglossus kowalevskii TaxID=10224 RepID=A0ABM0GQ64_SACKO|nr:PREDICTED: lectin BRA-3-like [Saccoglossus kowalevskii]
MLQMTASCSLVWVSILIVVLNCKVDASEVILDTHLGGQVAKRAAGGNQVLCNCVDYKVYTDKVNYSAARKVCHDANGVLAYIPDNATHKEIKAYIQKVVQPDKKMKGFWIGLNDIDALNKYVWETGDTLINGCDFTKWGTNSPNHKVSKKNGAVQACIHMRIADGYKWDDDYCHARKPFICMFYVCPDNPNECTSCMGM